MKKKGKILVFVLGILAVASIGGTLAAWSSELYTGNEYEIPQYKTSLEEEFESPDNWQPGIETEKQVWVSNNVSDDDSESQVPVIAKVEISQSWVRREDIYASVSDADSQELVAAAGENLPLTFTDEDGETQYAALLTFHPDNVVVLRSGAASESGLSLGLTYVDSVEEAAGKWLLVNEDPSEAGNYVLYYIGVIEAGEDSPIFLESVTMNPLLENTVTGKETYYEQMEDGSYRQVTVSTVNSKYGYDGCHYTMDIKMTTVQATTAAVEQVFSNGFYEEVIYYLANVVADDGVYDATDLEKTLTLTYSGSSGKLTYVPYRTDEGVEEGNWFMSFTDMLPGGTYIDGMTIENTSNIGMNLYMKIVPRDGQTVIQDELLELINMTVTYEGEVVYEGKATGASYGDGEDLQNLILLTRVLANSTGRIEVTLYLDPDIECDPVTGKCIYADQLSKIDWYFYISGSGSSGHSGGGGSSGGSSSGGSGSGSGGPGSSGSGDSGVDTGSDLYPLEPSLAKTGDWSHNAMLAGLTGLSLVLLIATGIAWKKTRNS